MLVLTKLKIYLILISNLILLNHFMNIKLNLISQNGRKISFSKDKSVECFKIKKDKIAVVICILKEKPLM